jgi:hypothetical protein
VIPGLVYRLSIGAPDGDLLATISSPVHWSAEAGNEPGFSALSIVDETIVVTTGANAYSLGPSGGAIVYDPFDTPVADVRVWQTGRSQSMGVVMPRQHRIAISRTSVGIVNGRVSFPGLFGTTVIGASLGEAASEFSSPIAMDVEPDGRIYVVDAGNSRIQVFDAEGAYITQWGTPGGGSSQFDFSPTGSLQFAGSIAVDEDGSIYVADVGNRRIQKFAP